MALEKKRWLEFWALVAVGACDSSIVRLEIENVGELEGVMRVLPSIARLLREVSHRAQGNRCRSRSARGHTSKYSN